MLYIFLSDLHIGLNTPTNWYQKSIHQKYLKAILRYIQRNGSRIKDVVMLGDWFEYWLYLPEGPIPVSLQEIFAANPDIFIPAQDGDFITCMDSIQGDFRFVNGNHDMTVSARNINGHFRPLSRKKKQVVCKGPPERNTVYVAESIYAEHGHEYSLFSRPDNNSSNLYKPLPIDYYICRTWSSISIHQLQDAGKKNAAYLLNVSKPEFGAAPMSIDNLIKTTGKKTTLAEVILSSLVAIANKGKEHPSQYLYLMPDGSSISASEAARMFPDFSIKKKDLPSFMVDISRSLTGVGEDLCQQGHKVVIMGHTHIPKLELYLYMKSLRIHPGIIVNTGFLCPSIRELNNQGSHMTFAEVELQGGKYYARLKKVDYPHTTISTIKEYSVDM